MGFRLAPREVAPLSSSAGWSPVFVHFGSGSPSLVQVLMMKMNEFAFAISTVHFRTLGKCIKAISEVQADGATENILPKGGDPICPKIQYCDWFSIVRGRARSRARATSRAEREIRDTRARRE